ncbi:MAG: CoA transferase, partial [Phycisphaerae bacterium]
FVPVNVYPTADGYIYAAIGSDAQWRRLTSLDAFRGLASPVRDTNEGRKQQREAIHREIRAITSRFETGALVELLASQGLVVAPIQTVPEVLKYPPIRDAVLRTHAPSGTPVRLPPPSVEQAHLTSVNRCLSYAPAYGQHTNQVLEQAGFSKAEISDLRASAIIA